MADEPTNEALIKELIAACLPKALGHFDEKLEALRTRLAVLTERAEKAEAHVLTLEMQAEDRKHRNASLENQLDIVSDALEEADDEVELVQDLICAPMEKKHARAKALRDYIQGVRERAEAAEAEAKDQRRWREETLLRAATAEAELARTREALEPFSKEADRYDPPENDDKSPVWQCRLTLGDLRRARAALAKKEPADE